jgi:hypothetical protein
MKIINAKYKSTCAETGCKINKGERMLYDSETKKCYAIGSNKAIEFINKPDPAEGMISANEEAYFDTFCQNNNI